MFVATKTSSRQAYFCSDKRRVLSRQTHVWQKHMFVATKGFHETPIKEHLANFAMVRHGNKQKQKKNKKNKMQTHTTEKRRKGQPLSSLPYSRRSLQKGLPKMLYTRVCSVMLFIFCCYNKLSYGADR